MNTLRRTALAAAAILGSLTIGAAGQTGTVIGRVFVAASDFPVAYATVSATPSGRELFTNADGRFVMSGLPAGPTHIVARRVGFSPVDTMIEVKRGDTVRVAIGLSLVTIQLPAVHSLAKSCAHPGGSDAQIGVELAVLFEQLNENAARNRLLSRTYPFQLEVERKVTKPEPLLEARFVVYDTIVRSSDREWRYVPGKMLGTREYEAGVFAGKWRTITMPELADFADERFLVNHCFDFAGLEDVDGDSLIRVDFTPAPIVHETDVAGAIFLDQKTYQLRIVDLSLVNLTNQLRRDISGQSIRARFREVIPGVPVLNTVSSVVYPKENPDVPTQEPATEHQRILSVKFLRGKP